MFGTPFTNINDQGVLGVFGEQKDHRDTAADQQECGCGLIKKSTAGIDREGTWRDDRGLTRTGQSSTQKTRVSIR
jgi:hypothetical protein